MPDLTIHAIPQEDLDALGARANRHGRSTESETLHLIHEAAAAERLVQQLERAQRAEDAIRRSEQHKRSRGPAAARPRYRTVEPTPQRTRHPYRDLTPAAMDLPPGTAEKPVP
jgi:plasmid stability protein